MNFTLTCSALPGYAPRTRENADACDLTVAVALDLTTPGERCTKTAAAGKYLGFLIDDTRMVETVADIVRELQRRRARTLNVAGNGLSTLVRHWRPDAQARADAWVCSLLARIMRQHPLELVRSGGQTGVDEAAIKSALFLGIPAHAHLPPNYLYRDAHGVDHLATEAECRTRLGAP